VSIALPSLRAALFPGQWVRNELWRRARAVPSLDLRFADNKTLTDAASGQNLVTFTRASSGTYVGSDGLIKTATTDEPRFDHNPTTGESLGLLVEEQRTNLVLNSEQFNDASWTKTNSTITANTIVSPDGSTTGDSITSNAGILGHVVQNVSQITGTAYTRSTFAKANQYTFCQLRITGAVVGAITRAYFNLAAGTVTGAVNCTASIAPAGNGWYRCSITYTTISTATASPRIYGQVDASDTVGDGTSGIYIWGAQLEAGAFPTSYIPTTTATATRSADVASITGANFSSWYRQNEGTVFADTTSVGSNIGFTFVVSDGTDSNRIAQFKDGSNVVNRLVLAGVQNNTGSISYSSPQLRVRSLVSAQAGNTIMCANGTLGTASTQSLLPTVDRITIGSGALGTNLLGGTIRRLTYWPVRLENNVLQQVTQ
jgi:hypothetical protein